MYVSLLTSPIDLKVDSFDSPHHAPLGLFCSNVGLGRAVLICNARNLPVPLWELRFWTLKRCSCEN